ncbi:hypothetical protein KSP39_PZI007991 [Platanthera zijinensis]|uniref:Uncharacterized protein n=1 Tax=Platanthera zijinensis TaxID=2320716 RepID=A0AAP0BM50_9ASPA
MGSVTRHLNTASEAVADEAVEASKPKRRKKKNLFDVAQFLPNWGSDTRWPRAVRGMFPTRLPRSISTRMGVMVKL